MFCGKCGKPVDGNRTICDECAALAQQQAAAPVQPVQPEVAAPVQPEIVAQVQPEMVAPVQPEVQIPAQQTVWPPVQPENPIPVQQSYQAPAQQGCQSSLQPNAQVPQDSIVLEQNFGEPKKKKKKKRTGLVIGILAAVLVAAVAAVVLCWGSIKGFWMKNFASPSEYMLFVEEQALAKGVTNFAETYDSFLKAMPSGDKTSGDSQMHLILGDPLITMLEQSLASEGVDADLSFLQDVSINMQTAAKGNLMETTMTLGLDTTEIVKCQIYMDSENNRMIMGLPGLSDQYVEMPLEEDMAQIDYAELFRIYGKLPSAELTSKVINTYMGIVLEHLDDVEKDTETIEVEDVEQKLTVLTMTISPKNLADICVAIMETAQDDEDLEEFLDALSDFSNSMAEISGSQYGYYYEETDLHADLMEVIPYAIEELENTEDFSEDNYLVLTDYVNNKHEICGRTLEIVTEGESEGEISYLTVSNNKESAMEFRVSPADDTEVRISGTYTNEKDILNGTFKLSADRVSIMKVKLTDCSDQKMTVELIPDENLWEDAMGTSTSVMVFASPSLILSTSGDGTNGNIEMYLKAGGQTFLGITSDSVTRDSVSIQLPAGPYVDGENSYDMERWSASLDVGALMEKLIEAGIPQELLDELDG